MGIFDSKAEFLDGLDDHYSNAQAKYLSCMASEGAAYMHYSASEVLPCLYDILLCLQYLREGLGYLVYQTSSNPRNADIIYFLDKFAGAEITWKSIVEAWVKDDF